MTALAFAIIPFLLSYRPVAFSAAWDIILMVAWGVACFGMKATFWETFDHFVPWFHPFAGNPEYREAAYRWNTMVKVADLNLAGMILFMISALMGVTLLSVGSDFRGHLLN